MKYINSAALLHAIGADPSCGKCKQSRSDCMCQSLSRMDICGVVEDVPYIEIVTCGECKYYDDRPGWQSCQVFGKWFGEDEMCLGDFCSKGERK